MTASHWLRGHSDDGVFVKTLSTNFANPEAASYLVGYLLHFVQNGSSKKHINTNMFAHQSQQSRSPIEPESGLKGAVDRELGGKYKRTISQFSMFDIFAEKLGL